MREYRDSIDKNVENLVSSLSEGFKNEILDEIETEVNECKEILDNTQDLTIEDFSTIKDAVNEVIGKLDRLSNKLY